MMVVGMISEPRHPPTTAWLIRAGVARDPLPPCGYACQGTVEFPPVFGVPRRGRLKWRPDFSG